MSTGPIVGCLLDLESYKKMKLNPKTDVEEFSDIQEGEGTNKSQLLATGLVYPEDQKRGIRSGVCAPNSRTHGARKTFQFSPIKPKRTTLFRRRSPGGASIKQSHLSTVVETETLIEHKPMLIVPRRGTTRSTKYATSEAERLQEFSTSSAVELNAQTSTARVESSNLVEPPILGSLSGATHTPSPKRHLFQKNTQLIEAAAVQPKRLRSLVSLLATRRNNIVTRLEKFFPSGSSQKTRKSATAGEEDSFYTELVDGIRQRDTRARERAEATYGSIPSTQWVWQRLKPVRSFGDLEKEFFSLAQISAHDLVTFDAVRPTDGLDHLHTRGPTKTDYGLVLLCLLLSIVFVTLWILVSWSFGMAFANPLVAITISPEEMVISMPVKLGFSVNSETLHTSQMQKNEVDRNGSELIKKPRQANKQGIDGDVEKTPGLQKLDQKRGGHIHQVQDRAASISKLLLSNSTYAIAPGLNLFTTHGLPVVENNPLTLTVEVDLEVVLQVSNTALFPTTVNRLTLGLAWLRPLNETYSETQPECCSRKDSSVVTGHSSWGNTVPFISKISTVKHPSSFPFTELFHPVALYESVYFDDTDEGITVPRGKKKE